MGRRRINTLEEIAKLEPSSPQARALRVRYIREEVLRYTRQQFGKKHDVSASTLHNWEVAKYGGLTEKGAMLLTKAFGAEGIPCTIEWLLYGKGTEPWTLTPQIASNLNGNTVTQELRQFLQSHANAVDAIVADDGMAPCFLPGDHVAGVRYFSESLDKALELCCIVQTTTGEVLVRKLSAGDKPNLFTLSSINPGTSVEHSVLKNISVFSAAPVIWFRRPVKT
jgi:DNA-binding XRE family transcriptional regulator